MHRKNGKNFVHSCLTISSGLRHKVKHYWMNSQWVAIWCECRSRIVLSRYDNVFDIFRFSIWKRVVALYCGESISIVFFGNADSLLRLCMLSSLGFQFCPLAFSSFLLTLTMLSKLFYGLSPTGTLDLRPQWLFCSAFIVYRSARKSILPWEENFLSQFSSFRRARFHKISTVIADVSTIPP